VRTFTLGREDLPAEAELEHRGEAVVNREPRTRRARTGPSVRAWAPARHIAVRNRMSWQSNHAAWKRPLPLMFEACSSGLLLPRCDCDH
jgi:hypothetical protein